MPKLYYPNADELQGATPLDERLWFKRYQSVLLRLVNTNEGRDLLCIDSLQLPIIAIEKNRVCYNVGKTGDNSTTYISDVRVGAKWGNVIRSRWKDIAPALSRMAFEEMMAWPTLGGPQRLAIARFATTTIYPDAHTESTTVDGRARESTQSDWDTVRAAAGDSATDDASLMNVSVKCAFNSDPNWESFTRGIVLFDASAIGTGDSKDSATLEVVLNSKLQQLADDGVSLVASAPASNTAVVAGDYDSLGGTEFATAQTLSAMTADNATYNAWTLNANGLANLAFGSTSSLNSSTGICPFGILMNDDFANEEPDYINDKTNEPSIRAADVAGTGKDPKLVIVHTSPFTPKAIMF